MSSQRTCPEREQEQELGLQNFQQKDRSMKTRKTGPWTADDIATLKSMADQRKSKYAMSARLCRTIQAIEREARKQGLDLQPRPRGSSFETLQATTSSR